MNFRWLFAVLFVFNTLAAPAQAMTCQDIWGVSNNLTDATNVRAEIETIARSPEFLHPEEKKLNYEQRVLLRTLVLQMIVGGVKKIVDVRRFWTKTEFKDLSEKSMSSFENNVHLFMATLVQRNQLRGYLIGLVNLAAKMPFIGKRLRSLDQRLIQDYVISAGVDAIHAIVEMRGLIPQKKKAPFIQWDQLSKNIEQKIKGSSANRFVEARDSIHDPTFMKELLQLGKTHFAEATKVEVLADGPASFAVRERMIADAKESIDMMVWGVLDDITGADVTARLAAKVREGVKVRVIVDGKVNKYYGYSERVKDMERQGIEVVRWNHPEVSYLIMHRKMLLVDGKAYVAGGINVGDAYSHKDPNPARSRWRDTDVYVEGPAVREGERLFAQMWNEQLAWFPERYSRYQAIVPKDASPVIAPGSNAMKVALIESTPGPGVDAGTTIMQTLIKSIRGAEKTVDIENAYVVLSPAIRQEIQNAIQRGVKVRVLTNSQNSVDEAIITRPIMMNAAALAKMGAEVYMKKGATLHSKIMIVDGQLSMVKSYNLHPRSERSDTEIAMLVDDAGYGKKMTDMFEADIHPDRATRVERAEDVKYNESLIDSILLNLSMRLGYDVL